ncbi:hypothetical protein BH11PLA1_BH11PLA1_17710 [soil metagenome]
MLSAQTLVYQKLPGMLPAGVVAAPIVPGQGGPLRVCALIKAGPGAGGAEVQDSRRFAGPGGPFVALRETYDASVVLGCIVDAAGAVQQWIEIWVQQFDTSSPRMETAKEVLSNRALDQRWSARCEQFAAASPGGIIRTGSERTHPQPVQVDPRRGTSSLCIDPRSGKAWALCEDDRLLESKGLGAYSTGLHRYLYQPENDALSGFVPVTPGAPTPAGAAASGAGGAGGDVREAMGLSAEMVVFNPGGGLLMVTPHAPVGLENYIQALTLLGTEDGSITLLQTASRAVAKSFEPPSGAGANGTGAKAGGPAASDEASMLFLSRHGQTGRLLETLYHKLALLSDCVGAVAAVTAARQEPMLNLTSASFRVHLGAGSAGLPFLWGSRVALATPGSAVALPIKGTGRRLFGSMEEGRSVYSASAASRASGGMWGELLIRRVQMQDDLVIVEATLRTQERVAASSRDNVWMRFGMGAGRVDLFAALEARSALASGELRVRSVPMRLSPEAAAELKAAEGTKIPEVFFEVAPLLSAPSDLYSLMVLGVRTLLVDSATTVAVALDEFLSLAGQVAAEHNAGVPLAERVMKIYQGDERFADALGPQRLTGIELGRQAAERIVPTGLWSQVLAALVRAAPGVGPDSTCRDLGDADEAALEKTFEPLQRDLYALVRKTRSMIVSDPAADAELHELVLGCM